MSVRVQDCEGREIKVGTRVRYGGEDLATVIEISEPDIVESEDAYGRERVTGLAVDIRIRFADDAPPIEEETVRASDITIYQATPDGLLAPDGQTFEEPGDLEVIE